MRRRGLSDHGGRTARCAAGLAVLVLVAVLTGCQDDGPSDDGEERSGPDLSTADLWLSFEGDETGVNDTPVFRDAAGGSSEARVVSADGGTVERVAGPDTAGAVEFPARCEAASGCPRAMLEIESTPDIDPGDRDFEFGATVWLAPDQTTTGSNIVQKGRFGTEGGQWKLQVDTDEGNPSCVVRGAAPGSDAVVVRSKQTVADSEWHRVVCRRDADGVTIEVDGERAHKDGVTGSVENDWPIRIGAPGVGEGDDQFHGRLDDVYLLFDS